MYTREENKLYMRKWRNINREKVKKESKERSKKRYAKNSKPYKEYFKKYRELNKYKLKEKGRLFIIQEKEWWKKFKRNLKCSRCDESHPACLDFHHLIPNDKGKIGISNMVGSYKREKILSEISKCIVLCSNCHKKEHYRLRNGDI